MPTTRLALPNGNRLLGALPGGEFRRLQPQLKEVNLTFGEIVYEPGATIRYVYFPSNSIVSLLSATDQKATLEVGMIGNEGMTGVSVIMGVNQSRPRALVQGTGTALRMESAALRRESVRLEYFHQLLLRYAHSLMTQMSLGLACNRFHKLEDRLARWLLMTQDRIGSDEFRMTQEFMSNMLAVRRERVNKVAGNLQKRNLIKYTRGHVTILNRPGLENGACYCYGAMKQESDAGLRNGKQ
ncbi:MAG: Crp/Fnr family transcriptional regulator [Acidobacteriota bacterium]